MKKPSFLLAVLVALVAASPAAVAEQRVVTGTQELRDALDTAAPGDEIVLNPGSYEGGLSREGLRGVTIRSADVRNQAVIEGGGFGLMLSDPEDVTLLNLVFRNQDDNGLNIDDAGSYETPATGVRLIGITVKDLKNAGNHDGIKLAGVQNFVIDSVTVENWGNGGSAIDFVGCHHGLVQNSHLKHDSLDIGGSGIRPKGGSKDIVIRANRIELPIGKGRAIQAGGSTDPEFFRFADGDSGYEARDIVMDGNVLIGAGAAISWVNIDGGIAHHNVVSRPGQWVIRILNEAEQMPLVATRNGQFHDNDIVFNDTGDEFNSAVNAGDGVEAATFQFARNRWFNQANPGQSKPKLPSAEDGGVYGENPRAATDAPQVWDFPWGKWIVNANTAHMSVDIEGADALRLAVPGKDSKFEPLSDDPLNGAWQAQRLKSGAIKLQPLSQVILIDPSACADCAASD